MICAPVLRSGEPALSHESLVDELLAELRDSGRTPEEVCRACPEQLPPIRAG
jgi:hypothetical protein